MIENEAIELLAKMESAHYGYRYSIEWGYEEQADKDWKEYLKLRKRVIKEMTNAVPEKRKGDTKASERKVD